MKHFVILTTFTKPFEEFGEMVGHHRAFLQKGYDRGWLLCSGPQNPKVGGVIIARAPSLEELQQFFTDDPYQINGLATYQFIEFEPVKRQIFLEAWASGDDV